MSRSVLIRRPGVHMARPAPWRRRVASALTWYGGQARAVAAEMVHPVGRTLQVLVDDNASAMVELAATQEQLLLGVPGEAAAPVPQRETAAQPPRPVTPAQAAWRCSASASPSTVPVDSTASSRPWAMTSFHNAAPATAPTIGPRK